MNHILKNFLDFFALFLVYVLFLRRRWQAQGRERLLTSSILYFYLAAVAYVTLMPVLASLPHLFDHPYTPMQLAPFDDYFHHRGDAERQIVLNVIMTIPFGVLHPLAGGRRTGFWRTILATFLLSLTIEVLQPLLSGARSSDITDLITNTFGGILGYGIFAVLRPLLSRIFARLRSAPRR